MPNVRGCAGTIYTWLSVLGLLSVKRDSCCAPVHQIADEEIHVHAVRAVGAELQIHQRVSRHVAETASCALSSTGAVWLWYIAESCAYGFQLP